jgi:hypothetical protein
MMHRPCVAVAALGVTIVDVYTRNQVNQKNTAHTSSASWFMFSKINRW